MGSLWQHLCSQHMAVAGICILSLLIGTTLAQEIHLGPSLPVAGGLLAPGGATHGRQLAGVNAARSPAGRHLLQAADNSTRLILAKDRTARRDPLDGFKQYEGGWDITNKHYWAAVTWTAFGLIAVAVLWLIVGLITLVITGIARLCRSDNYGPPTARNISRGGLFCLLITIVILAVLAIGSNAVIFPYNQKFYTEANKVVDKVDAEVATTQGTLNAAIDTATTVGLWVETLSTVFTSKKIQEIRDQIANGKTRAQKASQSLRDKVDKNLPTIHDVLRKLRKSILVVACFSLALIVALLVVTGMEISRLVKFLVFICWLLVAALFIAAATGLVANNSLKDTCVAMGEWAENPTANSALSDIIPCADQDATYNTVRTLRRTINSAFTTVNTALQKVPRISFQVCLPYDENTPNLDPVTSCPTGTLSPANASLIVAPYVCGNGQLQEPICIPTSIGNSLKGTGDLLDRVNEDAVALVLIATCSNVRTLVLDIRDNNCPKISDALRILWITLTVLSAMTALLVPFCLLYLWTVEARRTWEQLSYQHKPQESKERLYEESV